MTEALQFSKSVPTWLSVCCTFLLVFLRQDVSTSALQTFGPGNSLLWRTGLHPRGASGAVRPSLPSVTTKHAFRRCQRCPRGPTCPQLRATACRPASLLIYAAPSFLFQELLSVCVHFFFSNLMIGPWIFPACYFSYFCASLMKQITSSLYIPAHPDSPPHCVICALCEYPSDC